MNILVKIQEICYKFEIKSGIDSLWKSIQVHRLRKKKKINVLFVASFASQWKYSKLFKMMQECSRFNPIVLVIPMRHHEKSEDYLKMYEVLKNDDIQYIDFVKLDEKNRNIRESLKPDIIFYNQPYYHVYDKRVDSHSFKDKLICHSFYSYMCYTYDWQYNLEFHNRAWKLFYISEENKLAAQSMSLNKGRNVEVVGYLNADEFIGRKTCDVWKVQNHKKKRIIWAPHHSIDIDTGLKQSNFLNMADFMLELAELYHDKIQFSFKPHPCLQTSLYNHPDWGKEKTDSYYELWSKKENCQLDSGQFIDLFLSSDALINDCGSFTAEYIYAQKPAINCFYDLESVLKGMSNIGKKAMFAQYYGTTMEEISKFINEVVLEGIDSKASERKYFYLNYLIPPFDRTATENIYYSITNLLNI